MSIYIASKTVHGPLWKKFRAQGVPIISSWIDECGIGETNSFEDLWSRCIFEARNADVLVVYRKSDEILKGAFIEVGAALANDRPVYAIGCDEFSFIHHKNVNNRSKDIYQLLSTLSGLRLEINP